MSNKIILSQDDIDSIKRQQDYNPVVKYLRGKDKFNFAVGDYLIRRWRDGGDGSWHTETVSQVSKVPKRFQCVYQDEFGVKYIKALTSKGERLPHLIALTEIVDHQIYEVDPDYAEHIILSDDEEFNWANQKKAEKKNRDRITRLNKKLAVNTTTVEDIDEFIKKLQPGDKIRIGWTIPSTVEREPRIVKNIEKVDVTKLPSWERIDIKPGRSYTYRINYNNFGSHRSENLINAIIIDKEPYPYETV